MVRSHGPVVRSALADQLSSFGGGCEEFLNPPSVPSQVGQCADIQFSVHEPSRDLIDVVLVVRVRFAAPVGEAGTDAVKSAPRTGSFRRVSASGGRSCA